MRVSFKRTLIFALFTAACSTIGWFTMMSSSTRCTENTTTDPASSSLMMETRGRTTQADDRVVNIASDILPHMRKLVTELVDIRMALQDRDAAAAKLIDEKYDYFQSVLLLIESHQAVRDNDARKSPDGRRDGGGDTNTKAVFDVDIASERVKQNTQWTCAETYIGKSFGYPFFHVGFDRKVCKRKPLSESVTFVLDRPKTMQSLTNILAELRRLHGDVVIHTLHHWSDYAPPQPRNLAHGITHHVISNGINASLVLNKVIAEVKTKYILILPQLTSYDNDSDIERMLHVLITSTADIVGGAVLESATGIWRRPCQQLLLRNYTLTYDRGYLESTQECMQCDYFDGPILSTKDFLVDHPFDTKIGEGFYSDFFLNLRRLKRTVLSCPDVMFNWFKRATADRDLLPFVKKWDIKRIVDGEGNVHWFGCRRNIAHREPRCTVPRGMSVPPCCLENLGDAISFIFKLCREHHLTCELQEGTMIGALKFGKILPWEKDADLTVLSSDVKKLLELSGLFAKEGYELRAGDEATCCFEGRITGGTLEMMANGWSVQIYGQHRMESEPRSGNETVMPTKMLFNGIYVNTPRNPAQFVRNRYGREIFKHAEHWSVTNEMDTGWAPYKSAGRFHPCSVKGHHSCLDQYEADGDLQFRTCGLQ